MNKLIAICKAQELKYNQHIKQDIASILLCIGMAVILGLSLHFHLI